MNRTFKNVLIKYFCIFTLILFSFLFMLQKLFFNSLNDKMLIDNTIKIKNKIVNNLNNDDLTEIIDDYAYEETLLIYIIDTDNNIIHSSDSYKNRKEFIRNENKSNSYENPYLKDRTLSYQKSNYRNLPDNYDLFLEKLNNNSKVEYRYESQYIIGEKIEFNGEDCILYISVPLSVSGGIVRTMNVQLIIAMTISIIIAIIVSIILSSKFNKPVKILIDKAEHLSDESYNKNIGVHFCTELDFLSNLLDNTNEKLKNNKKYQNELLSNVTHDLRTPLTVIKGYAEMIKDVDVDNKDDVKNDAELIIKESDRLNEIIEDILEYSKLQLVDYKKDFEICDLRNVIENVIEKLKILANEKNIVIEVKLNDVKANVNQKLIERAVFNLIDNAINYAKEKVIVKLYKNDSVFIEVIDDGIGIPENELPYVFDRYYNKRMKKEKSVSGIGLSIVKQIAIIHNGKCNVDSKIGVGSKFKIEL